MGPLLQMHIALLALGSSLVTACQDGKFTACFFLFLNFFSSLIYFILFFIAFVLEITIVYFCALTSTSCKKKMTLSSSRRLGCKDALMSERLSM